MSIPESKQSKPNPPNATYDSTRTYFVKQVGTNYLIRGNQPLKDDGTFAYDELDSTLQNIPDMGKNFQLKNYNLLDLSIIDNTPGSERGDLEYEFIAFGYSSSDFDNTFPASIWPPYYHQVDLTKQYGTQVAGNKGSFMWWPVQGCSDLDNCKLVEAPQFGFAKFIDYIDHMLNNLSNNVIYIHCEHGHDRTSAVIGSYMLKYMGFELNNVLTKAPPDGAKAFSHDWETNYIELVKYYDTLL